MPAKEFSANVPEAPPVLFYAPTPSAHAGIVGELGEVLLASGLDKLMKPLRALPQPEQCLPLDLVVLRISAFDVRLDEQIAPRPMCR